MCRRDKVAGLKRGRRRRAIKLRRLLDMGGCEKEIGNARGEMALLSKGKAYPKCCEIHSFKNALGTGLDHL